MYSCGQVNVVNVGEDRNTARLTLKVAKCVIWIKPKGDVKNRSTECIRCLLEI